MSEPISARRAEQVSRRWPLISAGIALALALALGALVGLRATPYEFDAEWMEEIVEHRSPVWEVPSLVMNFLGGSWFGVVVVPLGVTLALVLARKRWSAVYFLVACGVSAGIVQILKRVLGRARPEDILITIDSGSFPSGHVANAATLAVTLGILLWRVWVWVAGTAWVVLMLLSRTYLGAHWLSDTVGGILIGIAVGILVWAPLARRIQPEWARRNPSS